MNIMKKLPGMALLIIFASCSSNVEVEHPSSSSFEVQQKNPSSVSTQRAKDSAKQLFAAGTRSYGLQTNYPYEKSVGILEENLHNAVTNDAYTLLKEKGYRESLVDAMYDYSNGISLEELVRKYQITQSELPILANGCSCIDYLNRNQTRGKRRDTIICTVAIASSVVTTIGAIGIASPFGLGVFLVSKALATASIAMCAS